MHHHRIDGGRGEPYPSGRVQALGVADALRVVLEREHVSWLLAEIDELRNALGDARQPRLHGRPPPIIPLSRDIEYDLRVLSRLRREVLAALSAREQAAVWAPAPLMSELIRGTARNVVDQLGELLHEHPSRVAARSSELRELVSAAGSWTDTYMALLEIEWFSVEEHGQR